MKTRQEVERLKRDWLADDCWDIEDTDGFEDYKDELLIFRLETENKSLRERIAKYHNFFDMAKEMFGA